jgi:SHS2 domain-containing protein
MGVLPFEEIEHTADLAMRVRGRDFAELLRHAAEGMLELSVVEFKQEEGKQISLELTAPDREQLLVIWLEELLYNMEMHAAAHQDFSIEVHEGLRLGATMREVELESIGRQIKAVTFHDLRIITNEDGLEATIVFDV